MAPLPRTQLRALTKRFQQQLQALGDKTSPALARAWAKLEGYDEAQIAQFVKAVTPFTTATKRAAVHGAVGYYALAAGVRPPSIGADIVDVRPQFREPFISTWQALKNGASFEAAVAAGSNRTDAVVRNLISSSSRMAGDLVVARARLRTSGFQRVADGNACAWCADLDGAIFQSASDADFGHDRCACSAEPILA